MTTPRATRVALVGPFPPPYGGMGVYFSAIEAGLRQEAMEPRRIPVPYAAVGGWRRQLGRVLVFARAALTILRTRPDVVHCVSGSQPNLIGNILPLVAAGLARRPSILSIAGGEFPAAVTGYRGVRRWIVRFILTRPQLVVACTEEIASALGGIGVSDRRIATVSNALPHRLDPRGAQQLPAEVEAFADAHAPLIASTSGWYDFYGSQDLVEAVRELRRTHPRLGLVLMVKSGGDAAFRAGLSDLVAGDGLHDAVLVREDERAVFPILRRADVFVRTPHHEGDAISVREALAVGTPVVASDVGFRPSGVVRYRPADAADLADRLRATLAGRRADAAADPDEGERNLRFLLCAYRRLAAHGGSPAQRRDDRHSTKAPRLAWFAGRVAAMSPREMLWRAMSLADALVRNEGLREQADAKMLDVAAPDWDALLQGFRESRTRPLLLDPDRARQVAREDPAAVGRLIAEADRVLAGDRAYFGYPCVNVGPIDWNYDPITDYHWPAIPSSRIDQRVASSDPKWIWELNRLQHLPVLAQAWLFTGEARYADTAFDHLDSWLDQNPVGTGIAWRGAFEAGIRAISVAVALQGLRNSPALTPQRYRRAVRMLDASARYCWHARSRFSSANNHLVGELAGLATVHLLFPELASAADLFGRALDALAAEADRQILADGAGAEQSVSYQLFTGELLAIVAALMRLRGDEVPLRIDAALDRSARYLCTVVGFDDPDPHYGDDDDGFALRLGAEPKRTVREHLAILGAVTGDAAAAGHGSPTLMAAWLAAALGTDQATTDAGAGRPASAPSGYAPVGGLVVLRSEPRRLTMDVGPLGYLSIAAHGHADALAVTLSHDSQELIVDPGTGSYYGNPLWRTAFRGTRAHATVCVDGLDQSEIGGRFYWSRHAVSTVRSVDLDRGIVDAQHDGYRRLDDPVVHRRWLIAAPDDPTVVVVDLLDGRSAHDVAVSWPLHPQLDVTATDDGHLVTRAGLPVIQLCYAATAPVQVEQHRGDTDAQLGWFSDRLEAREPAWLLTARARAELPLAMLSVLRTADADTIALPEIVRDGEMLRASWSECGFRRGLTIDMADSGAVVNIPFLSPVRLVSES
ncbi:MAG TPA: heparinase II/III family protein [Mycobacterium sp.]|nr:heparinase II/III family protein [Mycobacterium sp.]